MWGRRAFNRYELKYVVGPQTRATLRPEIASRMGPDAIAPSYVVNSLYFDSPDLSSYWEKIDGERFRRKLRIRYYGVASSITPDTPVWLEIKQRLNRSTQKRRAQLTYRDALAVCAGRDPRSVASDDGPFVEEVQRYVLDRWLRPVTVVRYAREAFDGYAEDDGMRVTLDSRLVARDRDLSLTDEAENRFILEPSLSIMEVKVNDRVAHWLTDLVARHDLQLTRISKYCQSIEAFGRAPRSVFHIDSGLPEETETCV